MLGKIAMTRSFPKPECQSFIGRLECQWMMLENMWNDLFYSCEWGR